MKKIGLRYLKFTTIGLGSFLLFLVLVTLVLNFLFKDQLIQYVVDQLNKQVDARINIAKIDFSLWRQFPNASVHMDDVYAQSSNKFKLSNGMKRQDTLLKAEKIFFEFNLLKLIGGKFELKQVCVKDGYVRIVIDKSGKGNFDILKPAEKAKDSKSSFELKDLLFIDTKLEYCDLKTGIKILGLTSRFRIKGNIGAENPTLSFNSSLFLNKLIVSDYSYVINKPIQFDLNLSITHSKYFIQEGRLKIVDLKFNTSGSIDFGPEESIDLKITGDRLNLADILEALPDKIADNLNEYKGKGLVNFGCSINGPIGKRGLPRISINFSLLNGTLVQKKSGLKLKDVDLAGLYTRQSDEGKSSILKINKFSSVLGSGNISGKLLFENSHEQKIQFSAIYNLNLNELKQFLNIDTLELLSGRVEGNIEASGTVNNSEKFKLSDYSNIACNGLCKLYDASIKIKSSDYYFEKINGSVLLNNDLYFNNISLYVLDNDFLVNGNLKDWLSYLLKQKQDLTLQADITSRNLDLSKYFISNEKKINSQYSRELLFPDHINLDLKLHINNFKLNKFNAKWASGYLIYKPKMFVLKSLFFETLSGRVNGNGAVIQDVNKNFIVKGQVDVNKLDIRNMFYTFNNFSQNILKDKHLKGTVGGKIGISSEWNNALVMNQDKLLVDADIIIENGELLNFEPMYSLSRFISLDELKNIRFSTLKNRIFIKDKQIIIPQMDVVSSAFDITASGIHSFDNHYTYKVKILLSDILWGKAKRAKKENEEFGAVEDDGLGKTSLPLSIVGYNKDYKITYDTKNALDVVKGNLKKQKGELKTILNEEFGWYKNDSTVKKEEQKKKTAIRVEWDDADKKSTTPKETKTEKSLNQPIKDDKPKIEWE
ncbi:MAG TPA: AsmA-like C-terminal region-containing protein [Bacteroidales bacterium]